MPTLSVYLFNRESHLNGGPFSFQHTSHPQRSIGTVSMDNVNIPQPPIFLIPQAGSLLVLERPDDEISIDLGSDRFANSTKTMDVLTVALGTDGSLRGPIRVTFVPLDTPDLQFQPAVGSSPSVVVGLNLDFHINTPAGCYAAEGTLTFFVQFSLISFKLTGRVFSFSGWFDEGPDICRDTVRTRLTNGAMKGMVKLQALLDNDLQGITQLFRGLYLLPGTGSTLNLGMNSSGTDDADQAISLGLLPFIHFVAPFPLHLPSGGG